MQQNYNKMDGEKNNKKDSFVAPVRAPVTIFES
jgi:hypothetical protein